MANVSLSTRKKLQSAGRRGGQAPHRGRSRGGKAREASGRAGGLATSADAEHMSKIGRLGGVAFHEKRGATGTDRK